MSLRLESTCHSVNFVGCRESISEVNRASNACIGGELRSLPPSVAIASHDRDAQPGCGLRPRSHRGSRRGPSSTTIEKTGQGTTAWQTR